MATLIGLAVGALLTIAVRHRLGQYYPVVVNAELIVASFSLITLRDRSDLTAPYVWINATLALLFVGHPLAVMATHQLDMPYHYRFELQDTYRRAIEMGGVAIFGINAPQLFRRTRPNRQRPRPKRWRLAVGPSDAMTVICLLLAGGAALVLSRSGFYGAASTGSSGTGTTAYLYDLPLLVVPALTLMTTSNAADRQPWRTVLLWCTGITAVFLTAVHGQRTSLLFTVAAPMLTWALIRDRRVNRVAAIALALVAFFSFGALRDANSVNSSFTASFAAAIHDPREIFLRSFTGDDTEMVDALAVELMVVPSDIPYRHGIIVKSIASAPIPRSLWSEKTATADVVLNGYLFDRGAGSASVAYSFVGEGFLDGGLGGVLVVSVAFGLVYTRFDRLRYRGDQPSLAPRAALLASATAFAPAVVRGILAYSLAHALFVFGPILAVMWWSTRRSADAPRPSS